MKSWDVMIDTCPNFTGGLFNSSSPGQNGRHFQDDILKCIWMNGKFCILIQIPLKFIPKGAIDINPELIEIRHYLIGIYN